MDPVNTKWLPKWRETGRWLNTQWLSVKFSPRGYWLARVGDEKKPTQHSSREAARRAAERRAKAVSP